MQMICRFLPLIAKLKLTDTQKQVLTGIDVKSAVVAPAAEKNRNGEGGIRTRGTREGHTGFRNRLDKPLRHLSSFLLTTSQLSL